MRIFKISKILGKILEYSKILSEARQPRGIARHKVKTEF